MLQPLGKDEHNLRRFITPGVCRAGTTLSGYSHQSLEIPDKCMSCSCDENTALNSTRLCRPSATGVATTTESAFCTSPFIVRHGPCAVVGNGSIQDRRESVCCAGLAVRQVAGDRQRLSPVHDRIRSGIWRRAHPPCGAKTCRISIGSPSSAGYFRSHPASSLQAASTSRYPPGTCVDSRLDQ
jgi:hypothetical protein